MKIRNLCNLPVLLADTAENLGYIEKAVVGDDFRIIYLVMVNHEQKQCLIFHDDFVIGKEAILIYNRESMKSYAHGEELSIYDKKLGDLVFDKQGKELGSVSDFIIKRDCKEVWGVEVSSGVIKDILDGRSEIPLTQVNWASPFTALVDQEGSDGNDL